MAPSAGLQDDLEREDLRTLRLQIITTTLAGLTFALLIAFVAPAPTPREAQDDEPCAPSQFYDEILGLCLDSPPQATITACRTNELQDGCICDGGRVLDKEGRCVESAPEGSDEERCQVAQKIITMCTEKRGGKSVQECSPEEFFVDSAVDGQSFEDLLAAFPGTFTVHFGSNKPGSEGLSSRELKAVTEQLQDLGPEIRDASRIILLARTDGASNDPGNDVIALRRLEVTRQVLELVAGIPGPEEADFLRKILPFGLGGNASLTIDAFHKRYTRIVDLNDKRGADVIANGLAKHRANGLGSGPKRRLRNALHRSVVVILVPKVCGAGDDKR